MLPSSTVWLTDEFLIVFVQKLSSVRSNLLSFWFFSFHFISFIYNKKNTENHQTYPLMYFIKVIVSPTICNIHHIYLGHLCLALSSQEAQIVDLILNHKVLLLTLKVLGSEDKEKRLIQQRHPVSNVTL